MLSDPGLPESHILDRLKGTRHNKISASRYIMGISGHSPLFCPKYPCLSQKISIYITGMLGHSPYFASKIPCLSHKKFLLYKYLSSKNTYICSPSNHIFIIDTQRYSVYHTIDVIYLT